MSPPPPHPYALGQRPVYSPVQPASPGPVQQELRVQPPEKRPGDPPAAAAAPAPEFPRAVRQLRRASSLMPRPTPLRLRPGVLALLFLPVPPLLALLYMAAGHALLRAARPAPRSIFRAASVGASLEAGATGGVVLALPLALLLYVLARPPADAPEDFFEDDASSARGVARWLPWVGVAGAVAFLFAIGGVAGPLGVACLQGSVQGPGGARRLLSARAAAAAGFVGGAVLASGAIVVGALVTLLWLRSRRRQPAP